MKRVLLAGTLLCAGLLCLAQQPRAQFNGCQAGFCTKSPVGASGVTVDATGAQGSTNSLVTTFDYTGLTIAAGNAVVCSVGFGSAVFPTSVTASWDATGTPQATANLSSQDAIAFASAYVFGVKAPHAGNKTFRVAWTNSAEVYVACMSYKGVNQTTPFPNQNQGNNTQTVSVVSGSGHIVQASIANRNPITGITATTIYVDDSSGNIANYAANYDNSGTNPTVIGDASATFFNQAIAATDIGP